MKKLLGYVLIFMCFFAFSGMRKFHDTRIGLREGDTAPEIELPDKNGNPVKLSSLRGKMVIVDFWASWCQPCRSKNPKLVKIYEKYKDQTFKNAQGLTIMSISLDYDKNKWLKAIEDDNLQWENHVSDFRQWKSAVVTLYNISNIPKVYIIDGNGVVSASDIQASEIILYLKAELK